MAPGDAGCAAELACRRAPIVAVDTATRTVTARLVTWNDPHLVEDPDGMRYREAFAKGALAPLESTYVVDTHHGELIGHMDGHRDDGTGHVADLHIADTRAGRDLLALAENGTIRSVSIEFDRRTGEQAWNADRSAVTRSAGVALHGVAFAFRPAHNAPILNIREEPPVTIIDSPIPGSAGVELAIPPEEIDAIRAELVGLRADLASRDAAGEHPLARFRSLGEFARAAYHDPVLAARTLDDATTGDNPGVVPPAWLQQVKGIVTFGRPAISATGGPGPLPDAGMSVNWPYFDGTLTNLVGAQSAEKAAITSVAVDLKKGDEDLVTYAGGSDISYQLIQRSSPSYLEAYMRIMSAAYAAVTDQVYAAKLVTDAGDDVDLAVSAATDATVLAALFDASMKVFAATGAPATAVIAAPDWFSKLGSLSGLWPTAYGTFNVAGTAQASTLRVNISGLEVVYDPYMSNGHMIVTNGLATRWLEDGPRVAQAEDVEKLGRNIAVWGLGAGVSFTPAGIVDIHDVGP